MSPRPPGHGSDEQAGLELPQLVVEVPLPPRVGGAGVVVVQDQRGSAVTLIALAGLFVGLGLIAGRLPSLLLAAPVVARCEGEEPHHA